MNRRIVSLALLALVATGCASARTLQSAPVIEDRRIAHPTRMRPGDAADEDDLRAAPLAKLPARKRSPLATREGTLANGVRVITVARHDFPSVACAFVLDRGAAHVPPAAAAVYAEALEGGSEKYDRRDTWEYLRYVGASVTTSASHDGVYLEVSALTPLFTSAVSRAAPMFTSPKLGGEDVENARAAIVAARVADADDPERRARELLLSSLFPAPHGYGLPGDGGTPDMVRKVHPKTVAQLRDLYLSPEHVLVACAGDLDHDAMMRTLGQHLGSLQKKPARPTPDLRAPAQPAKGSIVVVDRPGAAQSNVAIGWVGPGYTHGDTRALELLSVATGSGLSSRLNLKVRRELGATYGAHMSVRHRREASAIMLRAAIDTPRTGTALAAILGELGALSKTPLADDELAKAKQQASGEATDATSATLAGELAATVMLGGSTADVVRWGERYETLTPDDLKSAAARWIDPTRARIVVVGDAAKIADALRGLGYGEVDVIR